MTRAKEARAVDWARAGGWNGRGLRGRADPEGRRARAMAARHGRGAGRPPRAGFWYGTGMAVCEDCGQEMTASETRGCVAEPIVFPDGSTWARIPWGEELRYADTKHYPSEATEKDRARWRESCRVRRCSDCGVVGGELHHPGCDMEECPRCRLQRISCPCPAGGEPPIVLH